MTAINSRQVWRSEKAGAIKRLTLQQEILQKLEVGGIRIKVKSVGLNFADIFALTGLYSATPEGAFIPGLEYSGEISEIEQSVLDRSDNKFYLGQKVMGVCRFGGYASVIDSTPEFITPLPESWSFQQGAAYLVQTLTAYYALLELGQLKAGQKVLVQSAAGGVGLQAMKLIEALQATPIGTVSSETKKQFLQQLNFNQVIVREEDFLAQLKRESLNFDLVLDGVGGKVQKACFQQLNAMGRLIVFGAAEFTPGKNRPNYLSAAYKYLFRPKYDVMDMISDNKSVMAFNLIWLWQQVDYLNSLLSEMMKVEISAPHVGHEFDFTQAHDAIECLRQGNTIGKVVLNVD